MMVSDNTSLYPSASEKNFCISEANAASLVLRTPITYSKAKFTRKGKLHPRNELALT